MLYESINTVACTSKMCSWNTGSKKKNPQHLYIPSYDRNNLSNRMMKLFYLITYHHINIAS